MMFVMTPTQLHDKLQNKESVAIIDVRSYLNNPDEGFVQYKKSHLPEAVYLHLEKDLSGPVSKHGGAHPLPNIEEFVETLGNLGIDEQITTVIYDEGNHMFAARAWWMLYTLGHKDVYVLEGGFSAWEKLEYDVTNVVVHPPKRDFHSQLNERNIIDMNGVKNRDEQRTILIDSRAYDRYLGKVEPLYEKAGHIPGAKNYFWQDVLDEEGNLKTVAQLKDHFKSLEGADEIIVSCGSGISACPNILALKRAGFSNVKLYPGSFSDWISYEENLLETKDET